MKNRSHVRIPAKVILILLTVLCLVCVVMSITNPSFGSGARNTAASVIVPMQRGLNTVGSFFTTKAKDRQKLKELQKKNKELTEQLNSLNEEISSLIQERDELTRYRQLLDLDGSYADYTKIAACVISGDPSNWNDVFVIDKGLDDGIAVDMNVIGAGENGGGLVGIVYYVGKNYAKVRSIVNDDSNVSAMIAGNSEKCIVDGDLKLINDNQLNLIQLDQAAEVKEGDMIVTSNISNKFLPNLLIGYVTDIQTDANQLTQSGHIRPVVDFKHLNEVLVITQLKYTGNEEEEK